MRAHAHACLREERNKGSGGREGEILFQLQKGFVHCRQTKITLPAHVNPGNSINIKINTLPSLHLCLLELWNRAPNQDC